MDQRHLFKGTEKEYNIFLDIRRFLPSFAGKYNWSLNDKNLIKTIMNTDNISYERNYDRSDGSDHVIHFLQLLNQIIYDRYKEFDNNHIEERNYNLLPYDDENDDSLISSKRIEYIVSKKKKEGKLYYECVFEGRGYEDKKWIHVKNLKEYIDLINIFESQNIN